MKRAKLIIAKGREKSIERRHPWLFSGAVQRVEGEPKEGDAVEIWSQDGRYLAYGYYQEESIACKILSFERVEDEERVLKERVASAVDYRRRMGFFGREDTNVFRMVHAEGDGLPGLVADWYDGVLVLQAHSMAMHQRLPLLAELFAGQLKEEKIESIFDKSGATIKGGGADGTIWGKEIGEREVREHGYRLAVDFYEGQKTGFFIDQRENRELVMRLARGKRVMNCFGYTGGFSLAALKGGAEWVETVDISKRAIEMCERNVGLNFGEEGRHRGVVADVMKYLDEAGEGMDMIILDPPAFAKNHRALQQGLKGYRSINQRAMTKIKNGGLLMTFSCSQAVSTEDFRTMVFTAAANAGKSVRIVRQLPHAADHPVSVYHPEGEYLKGLLLEVENFR